MLKGMLTTVILLILNGCLGTSKAEPEPVVTPSKFGDKVKNIHKTIVITKPGVYDYEKTMHIWQQDSSCGFFATPEPVMVIRSSGVTVKNVGFKQAQTGIVIEDIEGDAPISNVVIQNVEVSSCTSPLVLPKNSVNLRIEDSILGTKP